jgi:VIT1/CCC1 family predicted Fe2+/Mn2+ transporter
MEEGGWIDRISDEIWRRERWVFLINPTRTTFSVYGTDPTTTEEVPTRRLYISAFTIGMGYLLGGLIPLLPYFFIPRAHEALFYSCLLTGVVLLVFGAVKARVTGAGVGTKGYVWGAVSTLLVGGAAAGAAYGIVKALEGGS